MFLLDHTAHRVLRSTLLKIIPAEMLGLLGLASRAHHHHARLKAYSCFDGDDLSDIEFMRIATHKLHFTPINPEYILGYYVSVTTLQTKQEVMKCCLSIAESCDELWIFARGEQLYRTLTEGMLAEVMMFRDLSPLRPVRIFDLDVLKQQNYSDQNTPGLQRREIEYGVHVDDIVGRHPLGQRQEIVDGLLASYYMGDKYPLVYVVVASKEIKYLDWARTFTLDKKRVPVNRHAVLGSFLLQLVHNNNRLEMLNDVLNIMDMTSEMWIFSAEGCESLYDEAGPLDVAVEMHLWFQNFQDRPIRFIRWSEAQVPKYSNPAWSLTSKERLETQLSTNSLYKDGC